MNIITEIEKEIAALEARLAALQTAKAALAGLKATKIPTGAANGRKRAPAGELERAIESVIKERGGQTNGSIRAALKEQGYAYSLTPLHVGKTLTRLMESKRIRRTQKGNQWLYSAK